MSSPYDGEDSCDETASSLGDSSYDFLDDRSVNTDDVGPLPSDDGVLNGDRDPLHYHPRALWPDEVQGGLREPPGELQIDNEADNMPVSSLSLQTPTASRIVSKPLEMQPESAGFAQIDEGIVFQEEDAEPCTPGSVNGRFEFEPHETLHTGNFNYTIRQHMATNTLDITGRPYKIFFMGDDGVKDCVTKKIASALAAKMVSFNDGHQNHAPSRFNVIPVSFDTPDTPEVVLIDSSGLELTVEHCLVANEDADAYWFSMADGKWISSWKHGSKYGNCPHWELPDVAIIFESEDITEAKQSATNRAESILRGLQVPLIRIDEKVNFERRLGGSEHGPFVQYGNRDKIAGSNLSNTQQSPTFAQSTIDLAMFLAINPRQMNRNLAHLASLSPKRLQESDKVEAYRLGSEAQPLKTFGHHLQLFGKNGKYSRLTTFLLWSLPLALGFLSLTLGPMTAAYGELYCVNGEAVFYSSEQTIPETSSVSITKAVVSPTSVTALTTVASVVTPKVLPKSTPSSTPDTELSAFLYEAYFENYKLDPNTSEDFIVQLLGNSHIVINTPRRYHRTRKAPALTFEVSRQGHPVGYSSSKIGDGVYALALTTEDAYGPLNVTVTVQSRPPEMRLFEIDFGFSWLQKGAWTRLSRALNAALRNGLIDAREGVKMAYRQNWSESLAFVDHAGQILNNRSNVTESLSGLHSHWTSLKAKILQAEARQSSRMQSRLVAAQKLAVKKLQPLSQHVSKEIHASLAHSRKALLTQSAVVLENMGHVKSAISLLAKQRLRDNQKRALHAWWKLVGVPDKPASSQRILTS